MKHNHSISNGMKLVLGILLWGGARAATPLRTSNPLSGKHLSLKDDKSPPEETQKAPWLLGNNNFDDEGATSTSENLSGNNPESRFLSRARKVKSSKSQNSKSAKTNSYQGKGYWFGYGGGYGKGFGKGYPTKGYPAKGKGCIPLLAKGKGQVSGNAFLAKGKGLPDIIYCHKPFPPSPTPRPNPSPPNPPTVPTPGIPTSVPTRSPFQTPPSAPVPPTPPVFVPTTQAPTLQDQTAQPTQYPERSQSGTLCDNVQQCNADVPNDEPPFVCEQQIPCLSAQGQGVCLTSGNPRISLVWEGRTDNYDLHVLLPNGFELNSTQRIDPASNCQLTFTINPAETDPSIDNFAENMACPEPFSGGDVLEGTYTHWAVQQSPIAIGASYVLITAEFEQTASIFAASSVEVGSIAAKFTTEIPSFQQSSAAESNETISVDGTEYPRNNTDIRALALQISREIEERRNLLLENYDAIPGTTQTSVGGDSGSSVEFESVKWTGWIPSMLLLVGVCGVVISSIAMMWNGDAIQIR